jgi:MFS family permease
VAALSTAATLSITDISTPNNRASTMAPVMAAFSAGTALGPAFGGVLADSIGLENTFGLVGATFLSSAVLNSIFLKETQTVPYAYEGERRLTTRGADASFTENVRTAVGQWKPIWGNREVRNAILLNSCYWVTLAGSQMTLLPLMLTDPDSFALSATTLGKV